MPQFRSRGHGKNRRSYPVGMKGHASGGKRVMAKEPKPDKWYKHTADLHGWHHTQSEEVRHRHIDEAIKAEGYAKTYHSLLGLSNVSENENKVVSNTAKKDAAWLESAHPQEVHDSISRERE